MDRLHAYFSGTVQGVGFRYLVQNCAKNYAISGWVRNRCDGRVELLAEGSKADLQSLLELICEKMEGYIGGREVHWETANGEFERFVIEQTL